MLAQVAGMHFERMAAEYAGARPPYPPELYQTLERERVIGPGRRVLEIGAGSGQATAGLVAAGCEVVAIEPGRRLAARLSALLPEVEVQTVKLEDAQLAAGTFDSAVAATSMHWVDLEVGLPVLHAALRPGGRLAVLRHLFGDDRHDDTPFRLRVARIVAARTPRPPGRPDPTALIEQKHRRRSGSHPGRPTMDELAAGGWFEPLETRDWSWAVDLSTTKVRALFATFSDWSEDEVEQAAGAVDDLGGGVTEHYRTVLHLLARTPSR